MKTELEILNYHLTKDSLGVNLTQNDRIIHAMREYAEQFCQPPVSGSLPKNTTIWKKAREMDFAYFRKWWFSRVGNDR